ncbi:MAG: hypothetical protein APR53_06075 [Methanoculleus sp. SDB]|nr:MAG: hypothetical protein APR53_06075 [Methanoculleus sp. SDB]
MNILLLQREGIDLHRTLLTSETSRNILRFYRPRDTGYGVLVESSSLGGSLSLVSELKWYVRRYVACVLFEFSGHRYCTQQLAQEVYEREIRLQDPWPFKKLIGVREGAIRRTVWIEEESAPDVRGALSREMDDVFEVWASSTEVPG